MEIVDMAAKDRRGESMLLPYALASLMEMSEWVSECASGWASGSAGGRASEWVS